MYPKYGTEIRFTIVEDLGTREALDAGFHFAKIRLNTGEIVTASFDDDEFIKLKTTEGEIRGAATQPVFWEGPTTYNTYEGIEAAGRANWDEYHRLMRPYGLALTQFKIGVLDTEPEYPARLDEIPKCVDDFKLHPFGMAPVPMPPGTFISTPVICICPPSRD